MIDISVVATLYHSEPYLDEFLDRMISSLKKVTTNYEIIFVDDGSPDTSATKVKEHILKNKKIKLMELSRNFGHHKAVMAGLELTAGNQIFLIDVDLEEEPELFNSFYDIKANDPSLDVVYGYTEQRKGGIGERITGKIFYKLVNVLSNISIPPNVTMTRLMSQEYVKSLLTHQETHLFIGGIMQLTGYKQLGVKVKKKHKGKTTYNFFKRFTSAMDAIFSFSSKPLVILFVFGLLISFLSFFWIVWLIIKKVNYIEYAAGWASTIASIWFVGGVLIASVGMVGLYISKIYIQVKKRPNHIVKKLHNFN